MTKEQIKHALEIGEEEMCSPEMIEHCVFCREFMTPAMEALREIDQLMDSMEKRQPTPKELLRELIERTRELIEDKTEIIQLTLERDAAIEDLEKIMFCGGRNIDTCDYCKNAKCYGRGGRDLCDPEWRGIQKEER